MRRVIPVVLAGALSVLGAVMPPAAPRLAAQTDLDAFMRTVLASRDDNWKKLQQYVLDERGAPPPTDAPRDTDSLIRQARQPQFVSSAYFLRFKFEEGKYALVGHETVDGRDTLRIEYYPARLFTRERRWTGRQPSASDK